MIENLTQEQRKKIYEEEKAKIEQELLNSKKNLSKILFLGNLFSIFILIVLIKLSKEKIHPKLEDLRKAYPGL